MHICSHDFVRGKKDSKFIKLYINFLTLVLSKVSKVSRAVVFRLSRRSDKKKKNSRASASPPLSKSSIFLFLSFSSSLFPPTFFFFYDRPFILLRISFLLSPFPRIVKVVAYITLEPLIFFPPSRHFQGSFLSSPIDSGPYLFHFFRSYLICPWIASCRPN